MVNSSQRGSDKHMETWTTITTELEKKAYPSLIIHTMIILSPTLKCKVILTDFTSLQRYIFFEKCQTFLKGYKSIE